MKEYMSARLLGFPTRSGQSASFAGERGSAFRRFWALFYALSMLTVFLCSANARACSEIFIHLKDGARISARNFDFFDGVGNIYHTRVNTPRTAQQVPKGCTPLSWKAKYASISFNKIFMADGQRTLAGVDGMNTEGFKVGTYFLADSRFASVSSGKTIDISSLLQYMLDNFSSVEQAVADITGGGYVVTPSALPDLEIKLHLYIHDADGDSAIIEFLDGKTVITKNPPVPVLTNTAYAESLNYLETREGFGGESPIGGTESSLDRFARAAYGHAHIVRHADNAAFSVWDGFGAIQSVAVPFGFPHGHTQWTIVTDIVNRAVYFRTAANAGVVKIDLTRIAQDGKPQLPEVPLQALRVTHDMSRAFAE